MAKPKKQQLDPSSIGLLTALISACIASEILAIIFSRIAYSNLNGHVCENTPYIHTSNYTLPAELFALLGFLSSLLAVVLSIRLKNGNQFRLAGSVFSLACMSSVLAVIWAHDGVIQFCGNFQF